MNTYNFTGILFSVKQKYPVGYSLRAAKQAFADMRKDKSMWVHCETILGDILQPFILNESILCY